MSEVLDIVMPRLSDQMEEATVARWLKRPADAFAKGEPLVEVETDKATMVYEAEFDGVLEEIVVVDGETAALGAVIAAPYAAPVIASSEIGVSNTRSGPCFSWRPGVTANTPPAAATSSPKRNTRSSRASSSSSASRIASRNSSSGMREQ